MKPEYINSITQATKDVLKLMLDLDIEFNDLQIVTDMIPCNDANVVVGVTGDFSGSVQYSFPQDMVFAIVHSMAGMEVNTLDSFVTSVLSEIANIVTGNAVTKLSQADYSCDIVPPQIFVGTGNAMSMATKEAYLIPIHTALGTFDIYISLAIKSSN